MTTRTIHPDHKRTLYDALAAALAARTAGTPAEACAKIATHCREQWEKRLLPCNYRCERHEVKGVTVWTADGPCGIHLEFTRDNEGWVNCLSNSGETYRIRFDGERNQWVCGCLAFEHSEDGMDKHIAGWLAVRTASRKAAA